MDLSMPSLQIKERKWTKKDLIGSSPVFPVTNSATGPGNLLKALKDILRGMGILPKHRKNGWKKYLRRKRDEYFKSYKTSQRET